MVPAAELKAATRELAQRLAQNAPAALAATKALIYQAHITPIEQQLDAERESIIGCMQTDEFRAAVKKFTQQGEDPVRSGLSIPRHAAFTDEGMRTNIPRPRRRFEAADRFRDHVLGQPQHHASGNRS